MPNRTSIKISELDSVSTSLTGTSYFPVVQNNDTQKVSYTTIKNQLSSDLNQILESTFNLTTDSSGFVSIPTNVISRATGYIVGVRVLSDGGFASVFSKSSNEYSIQFKNASGTAYANTNMNFEILYILKWKGGN